MTAAVKSAVTAAADCGGEEVLRDSSRGVRRCSSLTRRCFERSGWDGVFVWEAAYGVDARALLAAIAVRTARVRLGTLLTPLPQRRPWKVASQAVTVDQLSAGRVILTVGLGAVDTGLASTSEATDLRGRAERLDERPPSLSPHRTAFSRLFGSGSVSSRGSRRRTW